MHSPCDTNSTVDVPFLPFDPGGSLGQRLGGEPHPASQASSHVIVDHFLKRSIFARFHGNERYLTFTDAFLLVRSIDGCLVAYIIIDSHHTFRSRVHDTIQGLPEFTRACKTVSHSATTQERGSCNEDAFVGTVPNHIVKENRPGPRRHGTYDPCPMFYEPSGAGFRYKPKANHKPNRAAKTAARAPEKKKTPPAGQKHGSKGGGAGHWRWRPWHARAMAMTPRGASVRPGGAGGPSLAAPGGAGVSGAARNGIWGSASW